MAKRKIHGSRAILTGASSGIGRCLAVELARQGADLVAVARRSEKLAELAEEVRGLGRRIETVVGDVTERAVRDEAIERVATELGGLDILVNNAGISAHGRFADASPDRLRRIMEVNFFAATEWTRAALPLLQSGRRPIIVNMGSILGHRAIPHNSEYCASKFALRGWTESLRAELVAQGIDVLLVSPGTTETELFDNLIEKTGELPWQQTSGTHPSAVAQATVRAIRRGKHEIIPSGRGRLLTWLNRLAPRLVDRLMSRYG